MDVSILQEAFEKVYKQSPAPMQVAQELGSTLHHSLNENSAAHNSSSILELFEKTVDCNNQSAMDTSGTADKRVPMVKLKRLDITEKNLSNCQKLYLWIIKPIPNSFGICVEGKRSLEDDDFWHSGMVTTRYSSTIIGTSSGSIYELIGEMEFLDALEAGIPEILAQQFKNGFPTTWDDLVDEHLPSDIEIGNASVLAQGPPENIFDVANTFISQQVQAVVPQQHEIVNTLVQDGSYLGEVIQQTNVQSTAADKMEDANNSNSNVSNSHNESVVNGNHDPYVNGNQDSVVNDDQDPDNNVHQDSVVNGNQDVCVVNEICIESEVTDSILNQTMVDKDIIDNNENILPLNKPTKKVADDILEDVDTQDRTPFTRRQKRMTSADEDMNESRQFDNSSVSTSDISFEAAKTTINGKQSEQVPKDIDAGAECHRRYENIKKVKEKMKDPPLKGRSKKGTLTVGKSKGPKSKKQNQDSLPTDTSESDFNVQSTVPTVPETNNTSESEIETISKKSAKTVSKKVTSAKNKTLPKQSSKHVADETTTEDNIIQDVVPQKSSTNSKVNNTQIDKLRKAKNIASKQSAKPSHVTLPDVEITSASSADEATEASESSSQIVSRSKKDKSKSKETKPATPLFEWIIRPFPKTKGVIVEGKRSGADAYWKSSSIAERKDARTIITDRGSTYKLVGNIEKLDAIDAGFSPIIVKAFTNGFPKKWNELIEKHYVSEDRSKYLPNGTMNVSSVSTKTGKTNVASPSEVLDGTIVGTPLGQFVDINHLKTTKSGRVVKPVLAKWAGQKVVYDPSSKQMKVVYNSKFGESYFKDQCIQMSAKTSRTSSLRKKIPLNASRSRMLDLSKMDSNDKKHSPSNNHKKLSKVNFEKNSVTMEPTQNDDVDDDDDSVDLDRDVRILIDKNQKKRLKNPQKLQTCYSNKMEDDDDDVMTSPSSRTRLRLHELRAKSDIRKKRKSKDRTDSDIDNNDLQPKRTKKSSNEIQLKNSKINSKFNVIELDSDIDDIVDQPQKTKPSYKTLPKKSKINGTVLDSDIDDIDDQHQKVKPSYKTLPKKSKINGTVLDSDIDDIDDQHQKAKPSYKTLPKKSKTNSKINGTMPDSDIDDIDDQPKKAKSRIKTQTKYSKINAKKSDYEPESESENDDEIIFKSKRESIKERTKSQTVPKSVTSKNGKVASKTKCSPVKKTVSKRRVKQTEKLKSKSLQKNPIAVSSSETDTYDDSWGKSEVFRLESALKCISQYDVNMWKRIAEAVSSRSLKECQEYVESHHEYQTFLQNVENSKRSKTNKRIEITAKKGTMKRRKQIREFLEQGIEGDEEPDLFDSTPFRAKTKKTIVPRLDEDVFSTETEFPITPGANCRTPSMKYFQAQFSAKKTPADCIVSPTNNDVNNAKADKIVHHYLKRRKMVKIKTTKKDSTIPKVKPNKPRTLFGTNGDIDDSIFQHSDHEPSDDDDDDEKDHYMSDMSSN